MSADCGSSLYSQPAAMPDVTIIRAGTLDGGAADIPVGIEFFTKDRKSYTQAIAGAQQATTMS